MKLFQRVTISYFLFVLLLSACGVNPKEPSTLTDAELAEIKQRALAPHPGIVTDGTIGSTINGGISGTIGSGGIEGTIGTPGVGTIGVAGGGIGGYLGGGGGGGGRVHLPLTHFGPFNPSSGLWSPFDSANFHLKSTHGADAIPVTGEFKPGKKGIGLYYPSTNLWVIRYSASTGAPDLQFQFGYPGTLPVVGHWLPGGALGVGVYSPNTGTWYLRNSLSAGVPDITFNFGFPGTYPVLGTWSRGAGTGIGVYEPSSGTWYLRHTVSEGNADLIFEFGGAGSLPVVGDWYHSGVDGIGVFFPNLGEWKLRLTPTHGNPNLELKRLGGRHTLPFVLEGH